MKTAIAINAQGRYVLADFAHGIPDTGTESIDLASGNVGERDAVYAFNELLARYDTLERTGQGSSVYAPLVKVARTHCEYIADNLFRVLDSGSPEEKNKTEYMLTRLMEFQ